MPVWARSDLASITVSVAHGGCGLVHTRPAPGGNPVKTWKLECGVCEPYLAKDPLFATSLADLPETPDETKGREDFAKRGATDRDNVLALAMAKLAGVELPQTIRQAISGASPEIHAAIAGKMVCENGHDNEPGSKFCQECGGRMRQAVVAACPDGHPMTPAAKFCSECGKPAVVMTAPAIGPPAAPPAVRTPKPAGSARVKPMRDWRLEDLQAEARRRGVDPSGTRQALLERMRKAKSKVSAAA
jgi:hypothetical protein